MKPREATTSYLRGGEKKKRADAIEAVSSRLFSSISSHDSVASRILARPGSELTSRSYQLFDVTKWSTTHEILYRNATTCYFVTNQADAPTSSALSLSQVC
jgi:hypothetical protein